MLPDEEIIYAPANRWLVYLAKGWRLQFVVEQMHAHHGQYAVLMWKKADGR